VLAQIETSLHKIAGLNKVKTIDLKTPLQDHGDWFPDHIHPNAESAAVIAQEVAKSLR
jgi:sialate O-acetylesterase